ncbi:MAG TPA: MG2 domain-containing protein [Steroidobacteraceae bacterium]|nr:MG2 domain-containing protein [Steroidobacteraceae bacterium]
MRNSLKSDLVRGVATLGLLAILSFPPPGQAAGRNISTGRAAGRNISTGHAPVRVESFSPQGYVPHVRQVVVRFSDSMVTLGDPRLADPFTVSCPTRGKGRWADTRDWVFDFDADLDAGVRCHFTLKPRLKSAAGATVAGRRRFGFETGGPAIVGSLPRDGWAEIDEQQVFLLRLDAQASRASIEAHAYCALDGLAELMPVRVLTGAQRQRILAERRALGYDYFWLLWKSGGTSNIRVRDRAMERRESLLTVLQCERPLPPGTRVLLHWGAGITSLSGIATRRDQQLAFRVRPAFIAQVECTRVNPRAGCVPMQPISVTFSAPVPRTLALGIRMKTPDGKLLVPTAAGSAHIPTLEEITFAAPFPESAPVTVTLPAGFADDAARKLENAARFPLEVRVDSYPPLAKFSGTFGILEAREGGILPVTLRNVEPTLTALQTQLPGKILRVDGDASTIASWLIRVEEAARPTGEWVTADDANNPKGLRPRLADREFAEAEEGMRSPGRVWRDTTGSSSVFGVTDAAKAFTVGNPGGRRLEEVIGIPLGQPGFYVVELASRTLGAATLGAGKTRYVSTAALVTDLAVHFLWGRESSLVWVTRLSTGRPVADAQVAISDFCSGVTRWKGRTGADGTVSVTEFLGAPSGYGGCPWNHPLLVLAKSGADLSFTESDWSQGIGPYEFGLPMGNAYSANIYDTVLDRTLFRAGESVSMKHFLRRHVSAGLAVQPGAAKSHRIGVRHEGGGQEYSWSATFDGNGVATSQWKIPLEAKLGNYVVLVDDHESGAFKVQQFRLPSMHGSVVGPAQPLVAPHDVTLNLHVAYLSGGGAAGLPVKVRTLVEPQSVRFPGYSDYVFGGKPVEEGVTTLGQGPADFDFDPEQTDAQTARTRTTPLTLDDSGSARLDLANLPLVHEPSRLTAELEYSDANGELMTTAAYVRLLPAAISLGIRPESWIGSPGQLRFRVVALGLDGKPRVGQAVVVSLYQSNAYSYRKRLIGGFYAYETIRDTKRLAAACRGKTNAQGLLLCAVAPGASGEIVLRAETRDSHGNPAGATTSMWVFDGDGWWFGGTSGDRMDLLPEQKRYEAGDTARFQVRMPFRDATALVTVEREGVMRSFVTTLQSKNPIINVPLEAADAPNVFISVLAVRGRVAHAERAIAKSRAQEVTALVDLTKPAYRLGIAQIKVGWRPHRLDVRVDPARRIYEVRDKVAVHIHVARADGQALPPGGEIAVAAVDEALLDLSPNESWKLLQAMMGERGLEVWTSTAQMQVVGKRHYGRKAVPVGGGGGRGGAPGRARQLFDSLLFWQPRIPLDARGDATVTVPLNDSLSAFRIVAVADDGAQLYGTGDATIHTTQDLILTSGLPPLVREGDRYAATFTVRNTTDHSIDARVEVVSKAVGASSQPQTVQLAAGQARDLVWPALAPLDMSRIAWDATARDTRGRANDHLEVSESAIPAYPVRTYQATIAQLTAPLILPVERPRDAIAGRGGLEITLQPSLAGSLEGVREYMRYYPYVCLEQRVSQAIALESRNQWNAVMEILPAYMDEDGLLRYFPNEDLQGDDGLTAYVLSIAAEAGWPIGSADRGRMLHALAEFVAGRIVRYSALPTADLSIRKLQAIDALARYGVAEPGMLDSVTLDPNLMPTSALLDWIGILERTAGVPLANEKLTRAFGLLRARLNFQGTTMGFSTERTDALWWLMVSEDSNANRMVLAALDRPAWRDDMPRLVRGALGRQLHGHWNTTVANAWGVLAIKKFSARFESTPVSGATLVHYASEQRAVSWPRPENATIANLPWQEGRGLLYIRHQGSGAPWAMVRAMAALPLHEPLSSGYKITRTITPIEQRQPGVWTRGDVARVHLDLQAQSDMTWVVVDDPIPAGATILGSGLGGQSRLLTRGQRQGGWGWLAYEERRFDGFRAYYELVPKGHWSVEYTVRFDNPGTFQLPATRVEAMYAPEMFGELPNAPVTVLPGTAVR